MVDVPESEELRFLREQLKRDEDALAAIEAALAQIPESVRTQVDVAAQRKEKYGFKEFVAYIRSWMTSRNLFQYAHIAAWLYGLYLTKYNGNHGDGAGGSSGGGGGGWLGGGGWNFTPQMAPADGSGSIVDAVFAKAQTRQGNESPRMCA